MSATLEDKYVQLVIAGFALELERLEEGKTDPLVIPCNLVEIMDRYPTVRSHPIVVLHRRTAFAVAMCAVPEWHPGESMFDQWDLDGLDEFVR